jgi:hypothetical protein
MLGTFLGFAAKLLAAIFKDWRRDQSLKELGASRERERQGDATIEVLARNAEGVQEADDMTEEERRRRLTDGS